MRQKKYLDPRMPGSALESSETNKQIIKGKSGITVMIVVFGAPLPVRNMLPVTFDH